MAKPLTNRFVIVLEKRQEPGPALNATAHMAAGLSALLESKSKLEEARFKDYIDEDQKRYASISDHPFIVLKGKASHIRRLMEEATKNDLPCVVFLDTMTIGTFEEQHQKTATTKTDDLVFLGACLFGPEEVVKEMTRRFSLWR